MNLSNQNLYKKTNLFFKLDDSLFISDFGVDGVESMLLLLSFSKLGILPTSSVTVNKFSKPINIVSFTLWYVND